MAENSGFFNSKMRDRRYPVSFMAEYFSNFVGNGVYYGGNFLKVSPSTNGQFALQVSTGRGFINGYYYALKDDVKILSLNPSHSSLARKDNIVLQLDLREEKRDIRALVIEGTPSGSPIAPPIERNDAVYQLKLAEVFIGAGSTTIGQQNITDFRLDSASCGIVSSSVPDGLTYDDIFNQMTTELNKRMKEWDTTKSSQTTAWNTQMTTQAGDFKNRQDAIQAWYDSVKTDIAKLQVVDFDNIPVLKGTTKTIRFTSSTRIEEYIKRTATKKNIASRITDFIADGSIKVTFKVYDADGTTELISTVTTTVFEADGNITETVV